MATDASVALSVQDNLSSAIVGMKNSVTNFRSDITALQGELDRLNATRVQMKMDLTGAKREAQQAQKIFEALGDSATEAERQAAETDWRRAEENLENIRQQYDLVSRQVRQTTRDMENASSAISRAENRAGTAAKSGGILSALGQAGAWSMVGDMASQWAGTLVTSAGGQTAGTLFSSALGGAASGAAIGTMIAPGIGTAIGAGAGALVGLVSGGSQVYEGKDEAFKDYYRQLYEQGQAAAEESLTAGSDTAAQRELDAIAFDRLLEGQGTAYLSDLRTLAADTPMEYGDLTQMSRALATGFGDDTDRMLELITAIGDAGSAVGVDASGMTYLSQIFSRMQSSGKVGLEELNAFQDRGIDVLGMLSEALGKTQGDIYEMLSKGAIGGQEAVDIIQKGMVEEFGGSMETMAKTFEGLSSTLADAMAEIDAAGGEGYNETRKSGLQAQADAYGGALGNELSNLSRMSGQNEAYMDNLADQYMREALEAVLLGRETTLYSPEQQAKLASMAEEYNAAKLEADRYGSQEARLAMENLYQETQSLATATYENSEVYQMVHDSEVALVDAIRENTAAVGDAAYTYSYQMSQALSKGLASTYQFETKTIGYTRNPNSNYHRAFGLPRVPYDNYPAILHEGERVLTAREARAADNSSGRVININISGNSFGAGLSAEEIAQRLADALEVKLAAGVLS